jgi:hypothetical protein
MPTNDKAQMILTDMTGKTIKTASIQGGINTINTNNLKGIFIVRLLMDKGNYNQKVVLN